MLDLRSQSTKDEGYWPAGVDPKFRALYLSMNSDIEGELALRMYLESTRHQFKDLLDHQDCMLYEAEVVKYWKLWKEQEDESQQEET